LWSAAIEHLERVTFGRSGSIGGAAAAAVPARGKKGDEEWYEHDQPGGGKQAVGRDLRESRDEHRH
jgi:hypothetical protein